MLFKLIGFFFKTIRAVIFLFVPEETRAQLKEGAKAKAATAGRAGFSLMGRIIVPLIAFCFIGFASLVYANIPSLFNSSSDEDERGRYDMSDSYNRPKVKRGGQTYTVKPIEELEKKPLILTDDDKKLLQGTWQAIYFQAGETDYTKEAAKDMQFIFRGEKLIVKGNFIGQPDKDIEATYKVDSTTVPKQLDIIFPDGRQLGIYEISNDRLKICSIKSSPSTKPVRPESFNEVNDEKILVEFEKQ